MKRIDFENGKITSNILNAAIPMLIAQILSLLYNIVDRNWQNFATISRTFSSSYDWNDC